MVNRRVAAGAALLLAVALGRAADDRAELQRLQEERLRLELDLELVLRRIPPEFDPGEAAASLRRMAEDAGIGALEVRPGAPANPYLHGDSTAGVELHPVDVRGRAPWPAIDAFVRRIPARPRAMRVESLDAAASFGETVAFEARVVFPSYARDEVTTASHRGGVIPALRKEIEATRGMLAALTDWLAPERDHWLNAIARLEEELADVPVAVTALAFDRDLTLRGFLVGSRARERLLDALEMGRLAVVTEELARDGRCEAFVLTVRAGGEEPPRGAGGPSLFDEGAPDFCRDGYDAPVETIVVGSAKAAGAPPALQLRDVSVRDAFFILNDLVAESFVVDGDVNGRVTLEVRDGSTVEETLDAFARAGVVVGSGPVKRVARKRTSGLPEPAGSETPVNVQLHAADVSAVLCLIGHLSEREFRVPAGFRARLSVFATETPLRALEGATLAAAGLTASETGGVVRAGAAAGETLVNACENAGSSPRLATAARINREFVAADVALAGRARVGASWRAYLEAPGGRILPVDEGSALFDATVTSVAADGVTLTTDDGRQRIVGWPDDAGVPSMRQE